jgi:peptidoglycan/xylan/chitin deacetylase (PgdA/CDA1 family)
MVLWDIDSRDWELRDGEAIYQTVMENIQNASIIVFHDDNPATVQALGVIIPELREMGYAFVTLSQFFQLQNSGDG